MLYMMTVDGSGGPKPPLLVQTSGGVRWNNWTVRNVICAVNPAKAAVIASKKQFSPWLGLVAVTLALFRFVLPSVWPEAIAVAMFGALLGGVAVIAWWAFFGWAPRFDRWGAVVLMGVAMYTASRFIDKSIATGMMGFMFPTLAIPVLGIAFAAWAAVSRGLADGPRRASMVAAILIACGGWTLLRTNGINGNGAPDFAWRWSPTREEKLLAQTAHQPMAALTAPVPVPSEPVAANHEGDPPTALPPAPVVTPALPDASWPGFRGPGRDSVIPGIRINTNWSTSPPVELWRKPVGPGLGSFAVGGELFYTQEQRGDQELVSCYNATTGNPVWTHRDAARFWDSHAGAGPRSTPALHDGHVYTFGPTGILNALKASDGAVVWSRNAATDTGVKVPGWGFASSPLVVEDKVVVAASGHLAAYDIATGAQRWTGPAAGGSYSSPHLVTIDGVAQILLMGAQGATSVSTADGSLLWKYSWPSDTRVMQPAVTADGDLLFSSGDAMMGVGIRRIAVTHSPDGGWATAERWTSSGLKPNFNDFVVHDGHLFGFDGGILACIDLKDGKRKWKGGRYGHGQLVLLREQGLLLVLSEEGELVLVKAAADQFSELARLPAIEGKTWNHPALTGDRLLVRNGSEMVAFRLALATR